MENAMTRCVVFETKGKLDLRSLTVFGLNAKPTTTSPIGFFGTGLKYAVAVLSRREIPFAIWIDGKKWVVEKNSAMTFRDKDYEGLTLVSARSRLMVPRRINLPFTTQL